MDSSPDIQVTLTDLITNPDYYLWRFDGDYAFFARMNRDTYKKSIFTDQRIFKLDPKPIRVDLDELVQAFKKQKYESPGLCYIFHVAHCGSTLLARAFRGTAILRFDRLEMRLIEMDEEIKRLRSGVEFDGSWGAGTSASPS